MIRKIDRDSKVPISKGCIIVEKRLSSVIATTLLFFKVSSLGILENALGQISKVDAARLNSLRDFNRQLKHT